MCSLSLKPVLPTARLTLRAPSGEDAAVIAKYAADFEVARMTTRMPHPYSVDDAAGFLKGLDDPLSKDKMVFAIDTPDDGLAGMIGFHHNEDDAPELGYWLGRPFWGRGYATEAAKAALRWARVEWGRKVVFAGHFADNPASAGVLIKSGFLYTGDVKKAHSAARDAMADLRMMVWLA